MLLSSDGACFINNNKRKKYRLSIQTWKIITRGSKADPSEFTLTCERGLEDGLILTRIG